MGIILSEIRISNFRSIESLSLDLGMHNVLIGQNNTGKSNFLRALNIAVSGANDLSENDIYIADDGDLPQNKEAVIDVLFRPIDEQGEITREFSDFWISVFTDHWISIDASGAQFVAIRTKIKFDPDKNDYSLSRYRILQWGKNIKDADVERRRASFTEDMRRYMQSFYMDANRDIVQDLRNRKSYFGRVTSDHELTADVISEIEGNLNEANAKIIESIPSLRQTEGRIAKIKQTMGSSKSKIEIVPLARKIGDLNQGMNIVMQDDNAASFSIDQQGAGTRSWISFLTLSAFVDHQGEKINEDDEAEQFVLLTMEEPEAHLHPQAQRQLFDQISNFQGQRIISTHAPSVVAQCKLSDVIYFSKKDGMTKGTRFSRNSVQGESDEEKIFREVINTRAELLFASAVLLCEGITEELALPVYFAEYFKCAPYSLGVNIISTGGQKYRSYLSLIKNFDIPWFILSDGEEGTIKNVNNAVGDVFGEDEKNLSNIVIFENGLDYENYLITEGYSEIIIEAICEHEGSESYFDEYINRMNGLKRRGRVTRDYLSEGGRERALVDLCHEHKAEYALPVAMKIVEKAEPDKKVPGKIKMLFSMLENRLSNASD